MASDGTSRLPRMLGAMMDTQLDLTMLRSRVDRFYRGVEIVTATEGGLVRSTYGDVLDRAARLAHALAAMGIGPGDPVATMCWNTQAHLEAYLAVPGMGAVLHTLNFRLPPEHIVGIVNSAADRVILVDASVAPIIEGIRDRLTSVERVIVISDDYEALLASASGAPYPWPELDERQAAAMCFTSGTTGEPKGVVYSHRSTMLHAMSLLHADTFAVSRTDVILPVVPMFHVNAWGFPYAALLTGARLVMPGPFLQPAALANLIEAERVTLAAGVPTIWLGLVEELDTNPRDTSSLRCIPCGGSAIPEQLMRDFDRVVGEGVLVHAWGMTETSPIATVAVADMREPDAAERLRLRLRQGTPLIGIEIRLWGLDGTEAPWDGEAIGEIEVRGPWVAKNYFGGHDPERFEGGWFRTGDVATGFPDGSFQIVDRTKDVIKSGGEWISSVELEGVILEHPAVRESAVVGRPDPKWSERPVSFVVLRPGATLTIETLRAWLEPKLPRWWLPDDLVIVEEIPKTGTGKIDKKELRANDPGP